MGSRPEQPIPETTTTFLGSRSSVAKAWYRAFKTAKSPQPGHQVIFTSDLYSAVVCGIKRSSLRAGHRRACDRFGSAGDFFDFGQDFLGIKRQPLALGQGVRRHEKLGP